ncbi:MAG TPA: IS110 family transposase [Gammaproteobacteria bacterium]|nr:IS110 family transposase [Gammaproteobacteria bacterium]
MKLTRIGLDTAKQVFQVHGVDDHGKAVLKKQLARGRVLEFFSNLPPCLVGIEACAGTHYWARELSKLGHTARLMAGQFVAPYRKSGKNDANDAEAICEAVGRPTMRFVSVKSVEQQAILAVHRARSLLVEERTALVNQTRGLLGEFGITVAQGIDRLRRALPEILEDGENGLPGLARETFADLLEQLRALDVRVVHYDRRIETLAREMESARRLMAIAGIGPLTATALVATVGDAKVFSHGRQFAAWLGLTPRQHSSGGKSKLGRISKRGDVYLRTLLIHGARSVLRLTAKKTDLKSRWAEGLKQRSGNNIAATALAAKHARIIWAMLARETEYRLAA